MRDTYTIIVASKPMIAVVDVFYWGDELVDVARIE